MCVFFFQQNVQFALEANDEKQKRLKESHATRRTASQATLREVSHSLVSSLRYKKKKKVNI